MKKQSFINIVNFQKVISIFLILLFLNPIYARVLAQPSIIEEGKSIIKNNYVNTVSDYVLSAPDLTEMVKRLDDPYSEYFAEKEYSEFVGSINNTFSGIGIGVDLVAEGVRITRVMDNSPAIEVGLKTGDIIIQADNNSLIGIKSTEEAIKYIKGEVGTYVKIVVKRGIEVLNFNIQRREIKSPTVESKMLANKAAYVSIVSFGEETGDLFSAALNKMEGLGARSYIIDLRYNGGGYMGTALDIAGHFIGNTTAIIIEDRDLVQYKFKAVAHKELIDKPIIFLINEYSASASEILAAAVKDYDKAMFVGSTTYGKGVAQQLFPLSDGSYLKLTVEKFYSPLGNIIHKTGVSPDFEVVSDKVDSLKVANLLLSGTSVPEDKSGYIRIDLDGKEFYIELALARSEEYWSTFNYILSKNATSNVYKGTNVGWDKVVKEDLSNTMLLGFSNYKILSNLKKDINVDKHFTINFNMPIDYDSIKDKGIELMSENTGKRISIKLDINNNAIIATPNEQLEKGQTYYLVVNDSVRDLAGNKIKQGTVIKYLVP